MWMVSSNTEDVKIDIYTYTLIIVQHTCTYMYKVGSVSFIYRHQAFYLTSSITSHTMVGLIHQASDIYGNASAIVSSLTWMLSTNLH